MKKGGKKFVPQRFRRLVTAALLMGVSAGAAQAGDRNRLWPVVRTCVSAYRLFGVSFPCLAVDLPGNDLEKGYAVLRPLKSEDLILSPTRKTVGVEDPFLQTPEAPNYFAAAWRARSFLKGPDGNPPERDTVALIVNSRRARSQDHLHIHIGCLRPEARRIVGEAAERLPLHKWLPVGSIVQGQNWFGVRIRDADLAQVSPFWVATRGFEEAAANPGNLMLMVVGARVDGEDDFLILAFFERAGDRYHPGGEGLLDRRCTAPSPLG